MTINDFVYDFEKGTCNFAYAYFQYSALFAPLTGGWYSDIDKLYISQKYPQREFYFGLTLCLPSFILFSICDRSEKRKTSFLFGECLFLIPEFVLCSLVTKWYPTLQPHGLQHTRLPCPSLSPRVCSNSCPLSWCYHPTISSSVTPFSSCLHSFPASESLPMSQLFEPCGQSIAASASVSVLPVTDIESFPLSK